MSTLRRTPLILAFWGLLCTAAAAAESPPSLAGTWYSTSLSTVLRLTVVHTAGETQLTATGATCDPLPCVPPPTPTVTFTGTFLTPGYFRLVPTPLLGTRGVCAPGIFSGSGAMNADGNQLQWSWSGRDATCAQVGFGGTFDKGLVRGPLMVTLVEPAHGEFPEGSPVTLRGTAVNALGAPLPARAFRWSSSVAGSLGVGNPLIVETLPTGWQKILLLVSDGLGATAREGVYIYIRPQ